MSSIADKIAEEMEDELYEDYAEFRARCLRVGIVPVSYSDWKYGNKFAFLEELVTAERK